MEKVINITAVNGKNGFKHFGINDFSVDMYGYKKNDIVFLIMKVSDNQEKPVDDRNKEPDYWGYYDNEDNKFTLIYPKYFLLDMCFPYGIESNEKRKQGKAYRLEIVK